MQVPVHLVDLLEKIQKAENDAYVVMGGTSKKSLSEILSEAIQGYVSAWLAKHGEIPAIPKDRTEFIKRLAASNQKELLEQLFTKQ